MGTGGPGGVNLGAVTSPLGARTEFLQRSPLHGPSRGGDGGRDQRVASGGRERSGRPERDRNQTLGSVPPSGPTDRQTDGRPPSWGTPRLPSRHPPTWAAATPTRSCPTPTPRAAPSAPNCSQPPSRPCPATPCGFCPARTRAAPRPRPASTSRWVQIPAVAAGASAALLTASLQRPLQRRGAKSGAQTWLVNSPRWGATAWKAACGEFGPKARLDGR